MEWMLGIVVALALVWLISRRPRRKASAAADLRSIPPPPWYNLENPTHVVLIDEIREKYAAVLAAGTGEFADLTFKPASSLPYPKEDIRRALSALLEYAKGERQSSLLDPQIRTAAVIGTLEACLVQLDTFLDVPPEDIPRDPRANLEYGLRQTRGG